MTRLSIALLCVTIGGVAQAQPASKVGSGIQVVPQAATPPKDAPNGAYWVNSASANAPYYTTPAGVPMSLAGGNETLAQTYALGAAASDQTMLVNAGDGGPPICKANAAATGSLFQTQTSTGTVLVNFTDNGSNTLKSAMVDGASAVALFVDTTTAWSNATAKLIDVATNAIAHFSVYASGLIESSWARNIGTAQTAGLRLANTTAAAPGAQQYSPLIELVGQGWKTDAVAASQETKWGIQTRPVQGTAGPNEDLVFWYSVNGSAYTEKLSLANGLGFMTLQGDADGVAAGPFVAKSLVNPTIGTAITLDATSDPAGLKYSLLSTGTSAGIGAGKFAVFDSTAVAYRFVVDSTGAHPPVAFVGNIGTATEPWDGIYGHHLIGKSLSAPTCVTGTGGGTGSTCTATAGSTDLAGTLSVTTAGADEATSATVATVTFSTAYNSPPRCMIVPAEANAQGLAAAAQNAISQADGLTTLFVTKSGATALGNAVTYQWNYHCIE